MACATEEENRSKAEPLSSRASISADHVVRMIRRFRRAEIADVIARVELTLGRRDLGPDMETLSAILRVLERLAPSHGVRPGVPILLVRGALPTVPRLGMNETLLLAEQRGKVALVPVRSGEQQIQAGAGIWDAKRGLLYYCAPPLPKGSPRSARQTTLFGEAAALVQRVAQMRDGQDILREVIEYVDRVVSARSEAPSLDGNLVLRTMGEFAAGYRGGVPLSILRAAFPNTPRPAFDRVILGLEKADRVTLRPLFGAPFADPLAAIEDPGGDLYYCTRNARGA